MTANDTLCAEMRARRPSPPNSLGIKLEILSTKGREDYYQSRTEDPLDVLAPKGQTAEDVAQAVKEYANAD